MVVRIKVKISRDSNFVICSALANTGYETPMPELLLPCRLAHKLELFPDVPPNTRVEPYETAGGTVKMLRILKGILVELIAPGCRSKKIRCDAVISDHESEVLLSDRLLSVMGIIIVDAGRGLWKLNTDGPRKIRKSEESELW